MGVHARPIVPKERLGHEGGRLAVLAGDVLDDILVHHHVVGRLDQRVETEINLRLAAGGHFVMLAFDLDAQLLQHQAHLRANVLLRVVGRHRKVSLLVPDFVT